MCTLTVVPREEGFRILFNRDERRDRLAARPARLHRLGPRTALYPVDPVGGGTWAGVNDAGLAAALLNCTPDGIKPAVRGVRSRSLIVPGVLACATLAEAGVAMGTLDPAAFGFFRLFVARESRALLFISKGGRLVVDTIVLSQPVILTSSSLGDSRVEGPRSRLFQSMMRHAARDALDAQRRFHDHQWPRRRAISVRMTRSDARTLSRTTIDATPRVVRLDYEPLDEACPAGLPS